MTKGVFTVTADTTVDEGAILVLLFFPRSRCQRARALSPVGAPRFFLSLSDLDHDLSQIKNATALDLLVSKRITGLPVVDSEGVVVSLIFNLRFLKFVSCFK